MKMNASRTTVGLKNTCYINAVLQCVASVPKMSDFPNVFNETDTEDNAFRARFILSLLILIRSLQECKNMYIVPIDLKSSLDSYKPFFVGNDMHDAHEFLDVILDVMPEWHNNFYYQFIFIFVRLLPLLTPSGR